MVRVKGVEPPRPKALDPKSSASASSAIPANKKEYMAVPTGIEPAISCVTGRHVNRYTTGPYKHIPFKKETNTSTYRSIY